MQCVASAGCVVPRTGFVHAPVAALSCSQLATDVTELGAAGGCGAFDVVAAVSQSRFQSTFRADLIVYTTFEALEGVSGACSGAVGLATVVFFIPDDALGACTAGQSTAVGADERLTGRLRLGSEEVAACL